MDFEIISTLKRLKTWLQSTMKEMLTWFSTLKQLKTMVTEHYVRDFNIIFHFKGYQSLVAEH